MRSLTRTVAALLVAAPIAIALPAMAQETGAPSGPVIIELDPGATERGGDVKVIRGSAVHPEPVARAVGSKAVTGGGVEAVGGDRLWLVDRKASEVTGCILAGTIRAGSIGEIRCTTERLP